MKHNTLIGMAFLVSLGACDGMGDATELRLLAEAYPTLTAAQVKARLDRLTVEDHWVLELTGKQWKWAVMRKACEVDPTISASSLLDNTRYNCAQLQADWQGYLNWHRGIYGGTGDPNTNAEQGRQEVLIFYKCQSGEIDAGSCSLYYGIQNQIARDSARTSQVIVDNIGNKCRVGVDPNCYP